MGASLVHGRSDGRADDRSGGRMSGQTIEGAIERETGREDDRMFFHFSISIFFFHFQNFNFQFPFSFFSYKKTNLLCVMPHGVAIKEARRSWHASEMNRIMHCLLTSAEQCTH